MKKGGVRLAPLLGALSLGLLESTYAKPNLSRRALPSYQRFNKGTLSNNVKYNNSSRDLILRGSYPSSSPYPMNIMVPSATPTTTTSFAPNFGVTEDPTLTNFGKNWLNSIKKGQNELRRGNREKGDWCASGECNDGLGIRRRDMPQTGEKSPGNTRPNKPLNLYIEDLGKEFGIESTKTQVAMNDLKPAQGEINKAKVEGMAKAIANGKTLGGDPPVVSSDGYVIDGHHRWAAMKEAGKGGEKINVIQLNAPAIKILAASAQQPQKNFSGTPVPYPAY